MPSVKFSGLLSAEYAIVGEDMTADVIRKHTLVESTVDLIE
jgi:hypothetical protein